MGDKAPSPGCDPASVSPFNGHHIIQALEGVSAPICMFDTLGVIVWTNAEARRLFGDDRGVLVGQSFVRFVAPNQQLEVRQALAGIALGETESVDLALTAVGIDGRRVGLRFSASVVRVDERVAGVLAVGFDRPILGGTGW